MLIADGFATGRGAMTAEEVALRVARLVEAGVEAVQLRDHAASRDAVEEVASSLVARLRSVRSGLVLMLNMHVEVARSLRIGAHVGKRGPSVAEARRVLGPEALLGYSAHTPESARQAAKAGADYLFFSPVFATASHPEAPPAGLDALARTCAAVSDVPVYALGGISPARTRTCTEAGAYGVAVLSALLDAPEPAQQMRAFLAAFP